MTDKGKKAKGDGSQSKKRGREKFENTKQQQAGGTTPAGTLMTGLEELSQVLLGPFVCCCLTVSAFCLFGDLRSMPIFFNWLRFEDQFFSLSSNLHTQLRLPNNFWVPFCFDIFFLSSKHSSYHITSTITRPSHHRLICKLSSHT